jgi:hypothetical protein
MVVHCAKSIMQRRQLKMDATLAAADKRLKLAKARMTNAFDLLNRGNLTPDDLREIGSAEAELKAANADMERLLKFHIP